MTTPPPLSAVQLVGLLAEPERRQVAAALILGASETGDIATTAGVDARVAVDALERLRASGLVEGDARSGWVLLGEAFKLAARAAPRDEVDAGLDLEGVAVAEADERVLRAAFRDGRLVHWPSKRDKRLVVLDHIAQRFEPGRRYTERQVNAELATLHDDTAMLRRWLVDEGFCDRADGEYWRSGGTVS
ncbi:MAG: DUF2087 domain-containing protein [Acidimicrobiales bacterium]